MFHFTGTNSEKLTALARLLADSEEGLKGVAELQTVLNTVAALGLQTTNLTLDVTLARGLNYYTGAIFEVSAPKEVQMGSIGGGGRYDDLTGVFGLKDMSGVGISFGLDRIFLVLEELNLLASVKVPKPTVLFLNFDESQQTEYLKAIQRLRSEGISAELYPDIAISNKQQKKQWKYATSRAIEYVVSDIVDGKLNIKKTVSNETLLYSLKELLNNIK